MSVLNLELSDLKSLAAGWQVEIFGVWMAASRTLTILTHPSYEH